MYNGVGLLSVRGSGTSGYVQTNKFAIRNTSIRRNQKVTSEEDKTIQIHDNSILEHNHKRRLLVNAIKLQDDLQLMNLKLSLVVDKVTIKYKELKKKSEVPIFFSQSNSQLSMKRGIVVDHRTKKLDNLANALGINSSKRSKNDHAKTCFLRGKIDLPRTV
jgi:serine/arginine repetitive matrix protein 2